MDLVTLVAFSSWLAPALASTADDDKDYESLRIVGLVFAVVLFVLGIAIIVSRKCTCSKKDKLRPRGPDGESSVRRV